MNEGRAVFAQLLDFFPQHDFNQCAARYQGNFRVRKFPAYEQFLVLAFAQLNWRESLRDIETCLAALGPRLYHSGFRQPTARSTLADANEQRDWRIWTSHAGIACICVRPSSSGVAMPFDLLVPGARKRSWRLAMSNTAPASRRGISLKVRVACVSIGANNSSLMAAYIYETIPKNPKQKPRRFEVQQSMKDAALTKDPKTGEPVRRVITGGSGNIMRGLSILSMNRPRKSR